MKKLLALLCIGIFLFSCVSVSAETGKSFDHTQLSRFAGYEYDASDRSWQYYVSTYCMGQKSPYFFTDTHLVHIGLKAYGYLSDPENVYTHLTILAMNSSGQIEDIDKVWLMFKVDNEVVTININSSGIGLFCPENKEALKYLSEGKNFTCEMSLKNSSTIICCYPTSEEMAGIKEMAKNLYKYNTPDYVSSYLEEEAKASISYTID